MTQPIEIIDAHNEMVRSLSKKGEDIIEGTNPKLAHLVHMTMGIVGEASEIERLINTDVEPETGLSEDLILELGDLSYYVVGAGHYLDRTLHDTAIQDPEEDTFLIKLAQDAQEIGCDAIDLAPIELTRVAGEFSEHVKKHWVYGKPLTRATFKTLLDNLISLITCLANHHDYSFNDVLEQNIEKLRARYKGFDYSDEKAIARVDQG